MRLILVISKMFVRCLEGGEGKGDVKDIKTPRMHAYLGNPDREEDGNCVCFTHVCFSQLKGVEDSLWFISTPLVSYNCTPLYNRCVVSVKVFCF